MYKFNELLLYNKYLISETDKFCAFTLKRSLLDGLYKSGSELNNSVTDALLERYAMFLIEYYYELISCLYVEGLLTLDEFVLRLDRSNKINEILQTCE
jgi:hypothetical protein